MEGDLATSAPRAGNSPQSKSVVGKHQVTRHQRQKEAAPAQGCGPDLPGTWGVTPPALGRHPPEVFAAA